MGDLEIRIANGFADDDEASLFGGGDVFGDYFDKETAGRFAEEKFSGGGTASSRTKSSRISRCQATGLGITSFSPPIARMASKAAERFASISGAAVGITRFGLVEAPSVTDSSTCMRPDFSHSGNGESSFKLPSALTSTSVSNVFMGRV